MTDTMLIQRASKAYFRKFGKNADMPSTIDSNVLFCCDNEWSIELNNVRGNLAVYTYRPSTDSLRYNGRIIA